MAGMDKHPAPSSMFLDGEDVEDLGALLTTFKSLSVDREETDGTAALYADVDGVEVPIRDEAGLFGVIAKLALTGEPLQFRTKTGGSDPKISEPLRSTVTRSDPPDTQPKRTRPEPADSMTDQDEPTLNSPKKRRGAPVGMSVYADGLIISYTGVFEKLVSGQSVLARVEDEAGNTTTRELKL